MKQDPIEQAVVICENKLEETGVLFRELAFVHLFLEYHSDNNHLTLPPFLIVRKIWM